jgi:hypothetical protein
VNQGVIEIIEEPRATAGSGELSPQETRDLVWTTQQLSENVINQVQINQAFLTRLLTMEKRLEQLERAASAAEPRWNGMAKRFDALIASGGLGRQNSLYLGDNLALARVLGKFKMFIDTSDLISCAALLADGYLDLGVSNWIPTVLRERMTFVDIGAASGYFTLIAASAVGAQGRVDAIEADPRKQTLLQRNLAVNGLSRDQGHCVRQHSLSTLEVETVAAKVPESFDLLRISAGRAGLAIFEQLRPRLDRNPRTKVLLEPGLATESAALLPLLLQALEGSGYTCSRIPDNGQIERVIHVPTATGFALSTLLVERRS